MGISRGFRRLSLFAAVLGLTIAFVMWANNPYSTFPAGAELILIIGVFGGIPAALVLLLGWVVTGFRNP
jgi:hypothetical protein